MLTTARVRELKPRDKMYEVTSWPNASSATGTVAALRPKPSSCTAKRCSVEYQGGETQPSRGKRSE